MKNREPLYHQPLTARKIHASFPFPPVPLRPFGPAGKPCPRYRIPRYHNTVRMIRRLLVLVAYILTKKQSSRHPSHLATLIRSRHPTILTHTFLRTKRQQYTGQHQVKLVSFGGNNNILKMWRTVHGLPNYQKASKRFDLTKLFDHTIVKHISTNNLKLQRWALPPTAATLPRFLQLTQSTPPNIKYSIPGRHFKLKYYQHGTYTTAVEAINLVCLIGDRRNTVC